LSYRSELAGIYSTLIVVNHICRYFGIADGSIQFACDSLSALQKVFLSTKISSDDLDCNIIMAARKALLTSPITWHTRHVLGHQEKQSHKLDRWECLNIEEDAKVKSFLATARRLPQHSAFGLEPWSLWYNKKKLSDVPSSLYELVHSRKQEPTG
jgi:hypothetical protein